MKADANDVVHRLSTEGADPLLLGGVNDVNLLELQRALGPRRQVPEFVEPPTVRLTHVGRTQDEAQLLCQA